MSRLVQAADADGSAALAFARRVGAITSQVLGDKLLSLIVHESLNFDA